jgi:hypothetical protein
MDPKVLSVLCSQVYKQFPAVNGIPPRVQERAGGMFQVSFRTKKTTADGKSLPVIIRVTSDSHGKISKISESR